MAQAQRELQPGEHVSWSYGAGQAKGQVVEKITENKKLGSRVFKASPGDPKYLVKSDTSGKEAIKKPETLHKLDEDSSGGAKSEGEARKHEVGAKEKRDHLKGRSSSEERKESESEENSKKVQDTGKGSVRGSAKAAKSKIKDAKDRDDELLEEEGEEKDATYEPKKDDLEVPDDIEALATLPSDEEVLAQVDKDAKDEGEKKKVMDEVEADIGADEGEEEDQTYDPEKEEEIVPEAVEDEEVINTLPPDEELIKLVEKENEEVPDDAAPGAGRKQKSSGVLTKKRS